MLQKCHLQSTLPVLPLHSARPQDFESQIKMKLAVLFLALAAALVVFAPGEHLFGYICEVLDAICAEWRASFRSGCRICA